MIMHVKVVIEESDGYYVATAPALPGLIIDGKTWEQVEQRLADGFEVYLQTLAKHGQSLTPSADLLFETEKDMSPSKEIRWLTPNTSEVNSEMLQQVS